MSKFGIIHMIVMKIILKLAVLFRKGIFTMGASIYIADDEKNIRDLITKFLECDGYSVTAFETGDELMAEFLKNPCELVILDIMMPGTDGLTICRQLRTVTDVPIIMLTAKDSEYDYVRGITLGSDDYLTKPFAMGELLARIRAMTRRRTEFAPSTLTFGNVSLNRHSFELSGPNGSQKLGNKEFQMIEALMLNHGTLISTERFMEKIWGYDSDAEINVVWVYISYLRKKLGLIGADIEIKATRGVGYTLEEKHND